jgi:hypothetical protein
LSEGKDSKKRFIEDLEAKLTKKEKRREKRSFKERLFGFRPLLPPWSTLNSLSCPWTKAGRLVM